MRSLYLSFILHASLLAIFVVAVCAAPPPAKKIKLESSSQALVAKLVTIEDSCKPNQKKVERTLEDMYTIATGAQAIKKEDLAFTHYFIPDQHVEKFEKDKFKDFPKDPRFIEDSKMVPKMYESIVTGGGKGTKFTVFCPTTAEFPDCKDLFAMTVDSLLTSSPRIALCEPFFREDDTKKDLSTKDDHQWCLEPPHLDNFITAAHTMLHEVTHLAFIVLHAVEAVVGEISKEAREEMDGTKDIYRFADEKDGSRETYINADINVASRTLKERWVDYLANRAKAVATAKRPPIAPINNAESYAAAGTAITEKLLKKSSRRAAPNGERKEVAPSFSPTHIFVLEVGIDLSAMVDGPGTQAA
ncbi:hypothetical protein BT96DRAFT_976325 [Gymnopus androsaceus JB14]|uniref:Lysine-specific metallo-endopeptidase domain-containing protein n=1 Tax=Gymnopus androsaceus JB14 TaxID=1447944 RepID=A0A6A4HLM6_9AGAR|nr:hypothetical protein BT96DRAFT_976325 [Gymnopus androsaceus JB14]